MYSVVCGKADMLVLVDLFHCPVECGALTQKFDAWLEIYLKLIADQFKAVSLIFFVPHAFVQLDAMGLLAVVFLAMGACVLLWLVVLVLPFFLFLTSLGLLGFLVLAFARLALLLR